MRGAPFVACALIAGCSGDGIYLEVRPPAGSTATQVELFLGLSPCSIATDAGKQPCDHMQPAGFLIQERAEVYFRQPEALVAPLDGGAARFHFQAEDKTLGVVIAVAFDGEKPVAVGSVSDFDLRDSPLEVIIDQSRATELTQPRGPDGDSERVALWTTNRDARCVGTELADGSLAFVVPESDPDCDAVLAPECDPLGYKATRPGDKPCVTKPPVGSACILGGTPCREDPNAQAPECLAEFVPDCVPDALCGCPATDPVCLTTKLEANTETTILCTFRATAAGTPCTAGPGALPAKLDLAPLPFTFKCSRAPDLGAVKLPLVLEDHVDLAGQTIRPKDFMADLCGVSFEWQGAVTLSTPQRQSALVSLHVDLGLKRRNVVLPMAIQFVPGCTTEAATCALQPGTATDAIWTCAH